MDALESEVAESFKMPSFKFLFFFLAIFAFCPCYSAEEGRPAPNFEAKLLNTDTFSSKSAAGNVVVLHFWATWCEACQKEMETLNSYYKHHHADGLQIVAINMDEPKQEVKVRELMKGYGFEAAFAKDASYKSYGRIWRLPLTFVIDRKGILQKDGWVLGHTLNSEDLEKTITPLLK